MVTPTEIPPITIPTRLYSKSASFAGTTYETVFRVMSDLEADRLIKIAGKKVGILKEEGLQTFIE